MLLTADLAAAQGTRVTALHVGYMDTDMTRYLDVPKSDPATAGVCLSSPEASYIPGTVLVADGRWLAR